MCGGDSSLPGTSSRVATKLQAALAAVSDDYLFVSRQAAVVEGEARLEEARSALQAEQQEIDAGAEALAEATKRAQVLPHPSTADDRRLCNSDRTSDGTNTCWQSSSHSSMSASA